MVYNSRLAAVEALAADLAEPGMDTAHRSLAHGPPVSTPTP